MKLTTKIALTAATTLFAGSALAFNDTMVDYPQNVAYDQQQSSLTRAEVQADLAANLDKVHANPVTYPSAFVDTAAPATQLTRQDVRDELAQFHGDGVQIRVSPEYPRRG